MRYRIGITRGMTEVNGTVFDVPGCTVTAPNRTLLCELLPVAIAEHLSWLERHGETIGEGQLDVQVDETEEVDAAETDAADGEFVFEDDHRPVTDADLERGIRHMDYATADLLTLVEPLPDVILDWRPAVSAMARVDSWQPEPKTIREIARELPGAERYYRLGLGGEQAQEPDEIVFDRMLQRRLTGERLRSLMPGKRGAVFHTARPWQDRAEHWTPRKVIRRIISHERFHTKEIEQRLAWLLLGVPEFDRPE
jgi:hypothetical protein